MKLQKQFIFTASVGCLVASLGFFLGANQLSDWTLFSLGATLIGATLCSSALSGRLTSDRALAPIKIEAKR